MGETMVLPCQPASGKSASYQEFVFFFWMRDHGHNSYKAGWWFGT
jgi:hypothetical protein